MYNSGHIKWTGYTTVTVPNFGSYSEILFIPQWYTNIYATVVIPVSAFKLRNSSSKTINLAGAHLIGVYYVSDTQIAVYDSEGTYDRLEIFVR